jgi:alkyl hydroperoxide reductase subunit AhpC
MAATLSTGDTAPDFSFKVDTPECTKQSYSVRDARAHLASLGVDVVGISADRVEDQAACEAPPTPRPATSPWRGR